MRSRTPNPILTSSRGAIDLASIMVGVIVVGLIGGVIAATVFAVIPWAQDQAAKQQVDSIVTAQNAFHGLSAAGEVATDDGQASYALLTDENSQLATDGLISASEEKKYCSMPTKGGDGYRVFVKSDSGKMFSAENNRTQPYEVSVDEANCFEEQAEVYDCSTQFYGVGFFSDTVVNCEWARGVYANDTYPNPAAELCADEAAKLPFLTTEDAKRGFTDACSSRAWGNHLQDVLSSTELGSTGAISSMPDYEPIRVN